MVQPKIAETYKMAIVRTLYITSHHHTGPFFKVVVSVCKSVEILSFDIHSFYELSRQQKLETDFQSLIVKE